MKTKTILLACLMAFTLSCKDKKHKENHKDGKHHEKHDKHHKGDKEHHGKHSDDHDGKANHKWGYSGNMGPEHWGKLYTDCAGKAQSPINIVEKDTKTENWGKLEPNYREKTMIHDVVNNGHSVQFNFEPGDHHVFNGEKYDLHQIHFHEPSEHTINGVRFPIVIHLVHKSQKGDLLVFAVMAKEGKGDAPFNFLESYLPLAEGETKKVGKAFSLPSILPKETGYFYYKGSLTTPPCSEIVNWIVFKNPITISEQQVMKMKKSLPNGNYRPTQPLNGREVIMVK